MEEVLINHPEVVEAAVVANLDDLKGEVPVGFIALGKGSKVKPDEIEKELVLKVREEIGPIACFK